MFSFQLNKQFTMPAIKKHALQTYKMVGLASHCAQFESKKVKIRL